MNLIVAVDAGWGIGYQGELLARVRTDLQHFRRMTEGKIVVLGSKTLATFPGGRVLKNRTNLVLSRRPDYAPEGAVVFSSLEALLEALEKYDSDDVFIIGGDSVYRQLLPYCRKAYVTKFRKHFEKDAYFPDLDADPNWRLTWQGEPQTEENVDFSFVFTVYEKME